MGQNTSRSTRRATEEQSKASRSHTSDVSESSPSNSTLVGALTPGMGSSPSVGSTIPNSSNSPSTVLWPTHGREDGGPPEMTSRTARATRASLPAPTRSVRKRLSRLVPARFHSTASRTSSIRKVASAALIRPGELVSSLPQSQDISRAAEPAPQSSSEQPPALQVPNSSYDPSSRMVGETATLTALGLATAVLQEEQEELRPPSHLVDGGPGEIFVETPSGPTAAEKGKQKAPVEPEETDRESESHSLRPSPAPAESDQSYTEDRNRTERIAAAQRNLDVISPPPLAPRNTTNLLDSQELPPPPVIDYTVEPSQAHADPEGMAVLSTLVPPDADVELVPRLNPTATRAPASLNTSASPIPTLPLGHGHPSITSGTAMIVQGVVQTSDLARGMHPPRGPGENSVSAYDSSHRTSSRPTSSSSASSSPSLGAQSARRRLFRMSRSLSAERIPTASENTTTAASSHVTSPPRLSHLMADQDTAGSGGDPNGVSAGAIDTAEGIDVLTMLLSVVTAATGTSLINGSTSPDLSAVAELVGRATRGQRSPNTLPNGSAPYQPTTIGEPRRRTLLDSVRSRLWGQRRAATGGPEPTSPASEVNQAGEGGVAEGQPQAVQTLQDETSQASVIGNLADSEAQRHARNDIQQHIARQEDRLATLRAQLTRQLTDALRNNPSQTQSSTPRTSHERQEPENVPLPPDAPSDFPGGPNHGFIPISTPMPIPPPSTPAPILGRSGDTNMSFEDFLVDIQLDLRATLQRRTEIDQARTQREERASAPVTDAPPATSVPVLSADEEAAAIRGRHLENHVPSVDIPLNWWRMFRFPPRLVAGLPATATPAPGGIPAASPLRDSLPLGAIHSPTPSPWPIAPAPPTLPFTSPATNTLPARLLTPVLIVGLRQQRVEIEFDDDDENLEPGSLSNEPTPSSQGTANQGNDEATNVNSPTSGSPTPFDPGNEELEDTQEELDSWRDQVRDFFPSVFGGSNRAGDQGEEDASISSVGPSISSPTRPPRARRSSTERQGLRDRIAARRDARRRREAQARERGRQGARESYVIWVIGGFYPELMVASLAPHFVLGQFDHDDFWALAELLGQVKPPVASKDEIENSGLEIIKTTQLASFTESGKISENSVDRCLICLGDYEEDENIRILSCKHAFHKDCVDTWMSTGRNNCPACRSTGVSTGSSGVTPASSEY